MKWGVFRLYDLQGVLVEVHVAPCDTKGNPQMHTLSCFCDCEPRVDYYNKSNGTAVYVHNHIH